MPKGRGKAPIHPHEKLLARRSRVGIAISTYDDLFSDFDPRPYKERQLSEDFLSELRRFFFDKAPDSLDIVLVIPAAMRSPALERVIKKRLHIYFHKKNREVAKRLKHKAIRSWAKVAVALSLMLATGYLATRAGQVLWMNIVKVMVEPASWFLFWTSIEELIVVRQSRRNDAQYFHRLSECKIVFLSA